MKYTTRKFLSLIITKWLKNGVGIISIGWFLKKKYTVLATVVFNIFTKKELTRKHGPYAIMFASLLLFHFLFLSIDKFSLFLCLNFRSCNTFPASLFEKQYVGIFIIYLFLYAYKLIIFYHQRMFINNYWWQRNK